VDCSQCDALVSQNLGAADEVQRSGKRFPDAHDEATKILQSRTRMDLLLKESGDEQQRVCMRVCIRVRRGLPFAPHAPLCIIRNAEVEGHGGSR